MKKKERKKKLTILHINAEKEYRGGEIQTVILSEKLIARGHESVICCQPGSGIGKECKRRNLPFFSVTMSSDIHIKGAYAIKKRLAEKPFDIIHSHNPRALAMGFILKCLRVSLPHIYTRRIDFPLKSGIFSKYKYSRGADSIIAVSSAVKKSLLACGIDEKKITVIHGGIEKERFACGNHSSSLKDEFSIPDNSFIIGAVSHLSPHKGHSYLIRAMEGVCKKKAEAFLIIAGEGPLRDELTEMSRKMGLRENIIFTGFRNDIETVIPQFDVLVHPTIEGEGSPSAIKEAMLSGVPVIASDIAPIKEIINNGNDGILIPSRNCDEIEKAIINIIDNRALRGTLSSQALKKAEKEFGIDESVSKTEALYYQVLKM